MSADAPAPIRPRIVAHRGGAAEGVQNSLALFRACAGAGFDGVELDVHRAADGTLVVHHDAWLDRSTDAQGPVAARSAADLAAVRLDGGDEGLPTLEAALEVLGPDQALDLHVEIKTDHTGLTPQSLVAQTLGVLDARGLIPRTILTSFRIEELEAAVAARPGLRTALAIQLSTAWMAGGLEALARRGLDVPGLVLSLEAMLLKSNLEAMTALAPGRLGVWNADDEHALRFWLARPVVQIITDRPTLAVRLRDGIV